VFTGVICVYAGPMTDEDWQKYLLAKLDEWLATDNLTRDDLYKHMGMTPTTFMNWRETGFIPRETKLLWLILDDVLWNRIHGADLD